MFKFRSWPICHFFLGYIFVASGLIVNFFMLLSCMIWPFDKKLYRTINRWLSYAHWANFTFWGQWWSHSDIEMVLADGTDHTFFGTEHAIVVFNHKYDIDWLMGWMLAERLNTLGGSKIYGKQMLKYVPLLGWAWYFTESIFLKRNWERDEKTMLRCLKEIPAFPYPVWLLLCCEGTRFTEEKHAKSLEYAKKTGLTPLKHHLIPRTKGFVHSMYALKGKIPVIYSSTVAFKTDTAVPTMKSIYNGLTCKSEIHIRRIELKDIPTDNDEVCSNWLHELYQEKDALMEEFAQTGTFSGKHVKVSRRVNDLVMWLFWAVVTCVPLIYYMTHTFVSLSFTYQLCVLGGFVLLMVVVRAMINVTEVERGDDYKSSYVYTRKR